MPGMCVVTATAPVTAAIPVDLVVSFVCAVAVVSAVGLRRIVSGVPFVGLMPGVSRCTGAGGSLLRLDVADTGRPVLTVVLARPCGVGRGGVLGMVVRLWTQPPPADYTTGAVSQVQSRQPWSAQMRHVASSDSRKARRAR